MEDLLKDSFSLFIWWTCYEFELTCFEFVLECFEFELTCLEFKLR